MRRYTHYDLEGMDITTLRAVCRELRIKAESIDVFNDKDAMIKLIYKYRGSLADRFIHEWDGEKINRLKTAIAEKGEEQKKIRVEVPAYLHIYKGIDSLCERGSEHKVYTDVDLDMTSAVLVDQRGDIQAFIDVTRGNAKNVYLLKICENMLNTELTDGIYRNCRVIFFPGNYDSVLRVYNIENEKIARLPYISKQIQEVVVREIKETDEVLVIDYGTSYTTAGTFFVDKTRPIWFYTDEGCEYDPETPTHYADCQECGRCALCPSAVAVRECSDTNVELVFGHEAKARLPMSRNSIFFDTKRWVSNYKEDIEVKDLVGNTAFIKRSEIVEKFLKYIIHSAEQQNKVRYKNICFTSPVKQKAMSISMYKNILHGYNVEEKDAVDEAVAVVYGSVAKLVEQLNYDENDNKSVLLIDCGGSTSDVVKCNYVIGRQRNNSSIKVTVGYANGDTNFGGNNLTYRIMQFLKIKLAQYYSREDLLSMDDLLNISYDEVFTSIDETGINSTYESFEKAYRKAGYSIPTNFSDYINDAETVYFNIRGNFYYLWNLAERIKIELYSSSDAYEFSFEQLTAERSLYMVSVRNEKGIFRTFSECPPLRILRDEINLLLKPEIYNLLKKFVEPFYLEDESMSSITNIMLSGQTTKIGLFRDVLKEYIAGQKARTPFEHSYAKKLKCIHGAVAYYGAKAIGRIRPIIKYESPIVPYLLTIETFVDAAREKTLITPGQMLSEIYSYVDRPESAKLLFLELKDHNRDILQTFRVDFNVDMFKETTYKELLSNYAWLQEKQGDVDRIEDGDVRVFIYTDDESWGFKSLCIASHNGHLSYGEERFFPFESTEWEINFFDGKR